MTGGAVKVGDRLVVRFHGWRGGAALSLPFRVLVESATPEGAAFHGVACGRVERAHGAYVVEETLPAKPGRGASRGGTQQAQGWAHAMDAAAIPDGGSP